MSQLFVKGYEKTLDVSMNYYRALAEQMSVASKSPSDVPCQSRTAQNYILIIPLAKTHDSFLNSQSILEHPSVIENSFINILFYFLNNLCFITEADGDLQHTSPPRDQSSEWKTSELKRLIISISPSICIAGFLNKPGTVLLGIQKGCSSLVTLGKQQMGGEITNKADGALTPGSCAR